MKQTISTILIVFYFCTNSFGQNDSIKNEILKYKDTKSAIISKGRAIVTDAFLANDKKKAAEVLNYLVGNEEDKDYMTFYPSEKWLLYYWIGQYDSVLNGVQHFDSFYVAAMRKQIAPLNDMLNAKLKEKLREQRAEIYSGIQSSGFVSRDKEFLRMNFDYLLTGKDYKAITQDTLNKEANHFLSAYPWSGYDAYVRRYIRYEIKASKWGLGFEFFSGYGIFTGDLAQKFSNSVPLGIDFDICYKDFTLYLRDYIGFSFTKDYLPFSSAVWQKDAQVRIFIPEASIGYTCFENKICKAIPFLGVASTNIAPTQNDVNNIPGYKDIGLDFTMTYALGFSLDLKLGKPKRNQIAYRNEDSYWFLRLRYAYNKPQFSNRYSGYAGDFHNITIGIGGFGRKLKHVK